VPEQKGSLSVNCPVGTRQRAGADDERQNNVTVRNQFMCLNTVRTVDERVVNERDLHIVPQQAHPACPSRRWLSRQVDARLILLQYSTLSDYFSLPMEHEALAKRNLGKRSLGHAHRATRRPMRPKPLMPILIFSLPLLDGSVMAGGLSATTARVCMIALRAAGFAPLRSMRSGEATRADCCRSTCGLTCPEKSFADGADLLLPAMH